MELVLALHAFYIRKIFSYNQIIMQAIEALIQCHNDHPYAKFWGVCNEQKWALDRCFREEKVINRKKNLEKARRDQARFRQRLAAKQQQS